jgi:hypothetical protein
MTLLYSSAVRSLARTTCKPTLCLTPPGQQWAQKTCQPALNSSA